MGGRGGVKAGFEVQGVRAGVRCKWALEIVRKALVNAGLESKSRGLSCKCCETFDEHKHLTCMLQVQASQCTARLPGCAAGYRSDEAHL